MSAKHVIGSLLLLTPMFAGAQDDKKVETTGEFSMEVRKFSEDPGSAKFNEYTDDRNRLRSPLYKLGIDVVDDQSGLFFDFSGKNLLRDDQSLRFGMGKFGLWSLVVDHNQTPHNLSFKAKTPFRNQGGGLFTVDTPVVLPTESLTPNATQLQANDVATAAWLGPNLQGTSLGTQRDKAGATLSLTPTEHLKFRLIVLDEKKEGSKIGYGPIGDRPPRTLAAQMAQPIDFSTRELRLEAEYNRSRYQAMFTYTVSKFENGIDTFRWQNMYATPTAGATFDQWTGHRVASFGQMPLAPDNNYQNATFSLGVNLPWSSRLSVTAATGKMEQDQTLLPYSTSSFNSTTTNFANTSSLPRRQADAEITTKRLNVDYSISPLSRLQLRAYFRTYDLENNTPMDNWWYVTSDTMGGNAAASVTDPTFVNQRRNLALAFKQTVSGLEASTYLNFWHTSFNLGLEREKMARHFREADTEETTIKGSFRSRPASWLSLRGKVLIGDRDGGFYNNLETKESYWYDTSVVRNNNNPAVSFDNHPDMRKFDVSDRKRNELELSAVLMPTDGLDISLSYRDRKDDFESDVKATQPLLGIAFAGSDADRASWTPGKQLGLLENNSQRYAVDISFTASERLTLNAFASREMLDLSQRGLEFNENNKLNPTTASLATAELGPWTRADSIWMAASDDSTDTYGLGAAFDFIPNKLNLSVDYSYSNGTVDIGYSGFGTASSLNPANTLADNYQFAFRTPPTVRNKTTNLHAGLKYQFSKHLGVGLHYAYDRYELSDWMQEANTPWFESVGSEYLLRDTSSATSNQWGNRLVNLGSNLAPSYDAHYVSVSLKYTF